MFAIVCCSAIAAVVCFLYFRTMKVALGIPRLPLSTSRPPVGAVVVVEAETADVLDMLEESNGGQRGAKEERNKELKKL